MNSCKYKQCNQRNNNVGTRWKPWANNGVSPELVVNNNNLISFNENSQIQEFYKNGKILITGGTGFIGKALAEKLLRTCVTVSTVYLLIRPKKGQTVEERCEALLSSTVSSSPKFYLNRTPHPKGMKL